MPVDLLDLLRKRNAPPYGNTPLYDRTLLIRAESAIVRLRAECKAAEAILREVLERHDDELTGAARGDVDNVRLDLLKAAELAGY